MQLVLEEVRHCAGSFSLRADGIFPEGIHLITGPIGAGKTTCAGIIAGVTKPDGGIVRYEGIGKRVLLMQFPEYHLTTPSVGEEAASWGGDQDEILRISGLSGREAEDPLTLSRGELRRLHLAAVLTGTHDLIILDEPFAGIDSGARDAVTTLITNTQAGIVIIITHDITSLPPITCIWEIRGGLLHQIGAGRDAIAAWQSAPPLVRYLVQKGSVPAGLSRSELGEAVCRIHG